MPPPAPVDRTAAAPVDLTAPARDEADALVASLLAAAELAPHATLVHDGLGRLRGRNDRAAKVLGSDLAPAHALVDDEAVPLTSDVLPWHVAATSGQDVEDDLCLVDPEGHVRWATVYSRVTDHPTGRVVVSSIVDTTERQQWARTLLADFRTRFETSWRTSTMPVFLLDADPEDRGRVLYANDAMHRLVGAASGELVGTTMGAHIDADTGDRSAYDAGLDELFAGADGEQTVQVSFRRADTGVLHPALLGLTTSRGQLGRPAFVVGFAIDHEPLAAAERARHQALRRAEVMYEHLRVLLGAFPDVVVRMDADGTYLELYGAPDDDAAARTRAMLGRTVTEVFPEAEAPGVAQRCLRDIRDALGGRTITTEYQLELDGEVSWIEARFAPLGDGEVLSLIRDVTELRRAEAARNGFRRELDRRKAAAERVELERELERAGRLEAMGHLAGGVAHDVNNLLGVIGNYAAAIDRSTDVVQVREDAIEIRRAVERGAALTRQLLLVGRSDATTPQLDSDVCEIVDSLATTLRRSFPEGAELIVARGGGDCHVQANRGRLEQAVMNLVVNARDALLEHGRVRVEVARRTPTDEESTSLGLLAGDHVVVSVADDGRGMSDGVRASAFRPFFTTKAQQGTGLGLTIVKAVAEEHRGTAQVTTSPKGTTVSIWLPAVDTARPEAAPVGPDDRASTNEGRLVLLVDDDEHVRRSTARILRELGFRVLQAADGAEALERLDRSPDLDAVVTDVRMPGMSGPQLAARVQLLRPGLPIVFVTGFADDPVLDRGGAQRWLLTKPYDPHQLARTLERALAARPVGI